MSGFFSLRIRKQKRKLCFSPTKFFKTFPRTRRMQWGQPYWTFSSRFQKKWLEVQKQTRRAIFFPKIICPQNVRLDTQIAFLTIFRKRFCRKSEMFSLKTRKRWKTLFFVKNYFPANCSLGNLVCIVDKLAKKFLRKLDNLSQMKSKKDEIFFSFPKKDHRNFPL